jgi:hypothetical protein
MEYGGWRSLESRDSSFHRLGAGIWKDLTRIRPRTSAAYVTLIILREMHRGN